jgi:hypothetical protein
MKHSSTLYVGLDVHKESIAVAYVSPMRRTPRCSTSVPSGAVSPAIDKLMRQLAARPAGS